jgi:Cys-rich protein (TIGR01571 family)
MQGVAFIPFTLILFRFCFFILTKIKKKKNIERKIYNLCFNFFFKKKILKIKLFLGGCAFNPILYSCFLAMSRRDLRIKHKVSGNGCLDWIQSLFCPCCVLLQDNEELEKADNHSYKPM